MQRYTLKEAMNEAKGWSSKFPVPEDHYIYVYRDDDVIFYVGRSIDPLERFLQHMGLGHYPTGRSSLGQFIREHEPDSTNWTLELYTLEECADIVQCSDFYMECLHRIDKYSLLSDAAEQAFIRHFRPCLNIATNRQGRKLPAKYQKEGQIVDLWTDYPAKGEDSRIANEGIWND